MAIKKKFFYVTSEVIIGEIGKFSSRTHVPHTITLANTYTNPVVFAQPASNVDAEPVVVRVSNIQSNHFDMFLADPSDEDGLHNTAESVSYLVMEAGNYWTLEGTHVEVGTVDTARTVGQSIAIRAWETVNFNSAFADIPVILSQTQSNNGELFLSTRRRIVSKSLLNQKNCSVQITSPRKWVTLQSTTRRPALGAALLSRPTSNPILSAMH